MEFVNNYFLELNQQLRHVFLRRMLLPLPDEGVNNPAALQQSNWPPLIIAYCRNLATKIADRCLQLRTDHCGHGLPLSVVLGSLATVLAFAATFVAKIIWRRRQMEARLLLRAGIFSTVAAFYSAIATPFAVSLKIVSWFIFAACFLPIII